VRSRRAKAGTPSQPVRVLSSRSASSALPGFRCVLRQRGLPGGIDYAMLAAVKEGWMLLQV
jgi:hypothetical protein